MTSDNPSQTPSPQAPTENTPSEEVSPTVADERDHYIPIRKCDLLKQLAESEHLSDPEDKSKFRQLCSMLESIFHFQYFDKLEALKENYFYFDPELAESCASPQTPEERKSSYDALIGNFEDVLKGANFVEVTQAEIEEAQSNVGHLEVRVITTQDDFESVRFFRRGRYLETLKRKHLWGLFTSTHEVEVYDNVVLVITVRSDVAAKTHGWFSRSSPWRPASVVIKYFRGIAKPDLNMLFPNVQVAMKLKDKLLIGLPAVVGGVPLLMNIGPALLVLLAVIGFYLGFSGNIEDSDLKKAVAAISGLTAMGGFLFRQWMKYERQALKYQKELSDSIYFRNVNNNAGIFDYMIGAAEAQETKEAFLAYYFLLAASEPISEDELDRRIEAWIEEHFKMDVDFEVDDGLLKLEELQLLLSNADGLLSVRPLDHALVRLDSIWDNFFTYNNENTRALLADDPKVQTPSA